MSSSIEHQHAFELLPWLVNGRLEGSERDAVEAHLRSCLPCRRELKEQQRLRTALREHPAVHISPQTSFDRLSRRLAEPEPATVRPAARGFAAFARFAAVGAAGVALLGLLLWLVPREPQPGTYRTLADSAAASVARIDVVFADSVTAAEREHVIADVGGEIVSGPTELGRYTVALDGGHSGDGDVADVLRRLSRDPHVRFAGLSLAPEGTQ
ncbi:MAG TPA: zf-HC2 domain-containing protein [Gammaproteobacteria bacterium]|nr:zf-HC2 domain-containing protein [Gammaproteobacteria bacterium]